MKARHQNAYKLKQGMPSEHYWPLAPSFDSRYEQE